MYTVFKNYISLSTKRFEMSKAVAVTEACRK